MTSPGLAPRARSAYAAKAAAKERRQKKIAIGGFVILFLVLAYEVPHLLKRGSGGAAPVVVQPTPPPVKTTLPKALRGSATADPFAGRSLAGSDPQAGAAAPGPDPFRAPGQSTAASSVAPAVQVLPQTIVIGTAGGGRKAVHGWIVILASIPTAQGQSSANSFARSARQRGLVPVSVLNSSNRRPLRGGYWVVYTGPYPTLNAVTQSASSVHNSGYGSAYIRQLIIYR